jgi:hypothetical protein
MVILNILGGISFAITLIALYFLGEINPIAHLIFLISYSIQVYIFVKTKQWFLIFQMIALFIFSVINYFKWTIGV